MSSFRTLASFSVHPPGIGDLDILPNGIAVTCGEDGYVCFTDMKEMKEIKSMRIVTDDGTVPSISVSATTSSDGSSRDVFVASSDNYLLNRYSLGAKATFEGCYLRCTEEIKYISSSKSYVAVVSEDLRSRIVLRANMERVLVLEGHKEPVKSIAIDPLETYVATAASDNTVKLFDISNVDGDTGEVNASGSIPIQYQQGMSNDDVLARVAWQPEAGSLLATPMRMNTVGLYERGTWTLSSKLVFPSFEGVFNSDVNVIAFSPNGKYVAAASMAKQIFVWEVASQAVVASFECDDNVIALSWLVDANSFAVLMTSGSLGHASNVVPSTHPPPTAASSSTVVIALPQVAAIAANPAPSLKEPPGATSITVPASADDAIVDEEEQVNAIKRSFGFDPDMAVLHEATVPDDEDDLDASATQAAMDAPLLNSSVVPMSSAAGQHYVQQVQATFQPGAVLQGPVILLAWNLLGDIEALSSADQTPLIVLRFNDKSKRGFKFHDTYNLTMADFDDVGAIFAAPTQDDMPAVVTYRAIESWNSSSSWHVSLPDGEDVVCVTTAGSFCFVASSTHFVRVYSMGGILLAIFALSGRIVSMASHRSGKLAVLYATSSAELHYAVYTIQASLPRVQKVAEGVMPPTNPPSTPLTVAAPAVEWVGFNDLGVLFFVQAGTGTVFALSSLVGLQWMPLVQPSHTHGPIFCVGIRDGTVYFLPKVLDQPLQLPRHHRPVLSTWAYEKVEDDALWAAHNAATMNPSDPIDYVVPRQAAADKAILLRVKAMCASDDVQKAYDLATCLSLEKSHAIAQQIATHFGLRELQSRLQQLQDSLFPIDTRPSIEVDAAAPTSMERRPPTAGSSSLRPPSRIPIMSRNATSPQTSTAPTDPVAKPPSKPTASTFVNPFKKREVAQEQKADSGSRKRQK
ncbi:hypothetical protein H310_05771 [Aphanomyces invadans]|uniref:Uncharacterized protein n=1 Tax=Aphanomyces invadans TaxID=157072 RepID=A0A024U7K3_9STRA|nr:hypothetical protein H310_05771 [Aphanomyces invadans]ETW02205.1 hypothetical protein H310_05771 [Aphanomyces invadans]|eukprot:XP_008868810.1 hypothetical protein H310_05771 [Aphanomyces invadans]